MKNQNWTYKKVKEVCDKASSNIVLNKIEDNQGDYPLYGAGGFVKGIDFYHRDQPYIGIVKDGSGVGRVDIYPAKTSLVGTMQYILPNDRCLLGYLCYALRGLNLSKFVTGAAIPHIYFRDYGELSIPVPPLPTQRAIVAELDTLNEILDKKRQQLKELDTLAQSIFYDMFGDPDAIFEKWGQMDLIGVCDKIVDCPHTTPIKAGVPTPYPCIRTSELKGGIIHWDSMQYVFEEEYQKRVSRLMPKAGDIIYGREGSFGDAVILPEGWQFCLGQRTMLFRANNSIVNNSYLHRALISEVVLSQAKDKNVASTVAHVNVKDIKRFKIPIPPLPLQQSFARKVEAIEKQKGLINASIKEVEMLFNARMGYYFGE